MINKKIFIMLAILMLLPSTLWAKNQWNTPDKGYFNTQKDIDTTVSDLSESSATIAFGGELYNFIKYGSGAGYKIIVRELTNIGENGTIEWECKKDDDIHALKGMSYLYFQPTPVVFQDKLILFVYDKKDSLSYSTYNPAAKTWSPLKELETFNDVTPAYMSAVVIGKKLCLITLGDDGKALLSSTEDLVEWVTTPADLPVGFVPDCGAHFEISAVTQTYMKGNALEEKLLIGYINTSQHARCAEYDLDLESGEFTKIINKSIASDQKYSSVTLVPGSVAGDPSTGNMVQAFLKKAKLDNWYQRCRILRYQTIIDENGASGDWTNQENNLVKQNYLWASKKVNLTAVNFPVTDGETIRQYMCLIYRGYDDWDHPLNCAWVETDKLEQIGEDLQQTLMEPEYVQYVGYIEGPPPYYKNNEKGLDAPLNGPTAAWISSMEFTHEEETSDDEGTKFTIEPKVKCSFAGFKVSLSGEYGRSKDVIKTATFSNTIEAHPTDEPVGRYITFQPVINRADYKVSDVHNKYLYTTYYFWMSEPLFINEPVTGLADSRLDPQFPGSYMNRDINFASFEPVNKKKSADVSWSKGSSDSVTIKLTGEDITTNTSLTKIKLGYETGKKHIWKLDVELNGSIEIEMETTTMTSNEVTFTTDLNEPVEETDLDILSYTAHWLKPTKGGENNWWLHPGQDPDQNTWCITYEVKFMRTNNGVEYYPGQ